MPCAIFCFDATKGNDRSSASAVCLMKTVKILSCRIVVKFDTLIRDYCFFYAYLCKQYISNKLGQLRDRSAQSDLG